MRHRSCCVVLLLLLAWGAVPIAQAAGRGEPGPAFPARVAIADEARELKLLVDLGIDIDGVFHGWARVYLIEEELRKLRRLGFDVTVLPDESKLMAARTEQRAQEGIADGTPAYHTYETLTTELHQIAFNHANIVRLVSIGQSVQGREMWMMKISDNPGLEEDEPEVAYIAAMHGDEVVGKEMCFELIRHLTEGYGSDPRVTDLVDGTEIWIMPSTNPDGTASGQRYNAHGVDLNRDFPDRISDPVNTPEGREPETQAVMQWAAAHSTNLSGSMHCGVLVANYPFDSNSNGQTDYTATPDDNVFVSVSRTYADNNPAMAVSNDHPSFDHGICNGADWYVIYGGVQDWSYVWHGNSLVTLEISNADWPPASTLPGYLADNLESMLSYFERVHEGVRGTVSAAVNGLPLAATIKVTGNDFVSHTDPDVGDYHRLLLPGSYSLEFSAVGYNTRLLDVVVTSGSATRHDVTLEPLAVSLHPVSGRVEDGAAGNGRLDGGETADLAVTLRNLGRSASTIHADLEPTGWFAQVPRMGANYPDLEPGESAESLPPHHQVSLSPEIPPGHKVGFALRWASQTSTGVTEPLFVPVGEPQCASFAAADLPRSILDRQTTSSSLDVPPELELYGVTVSVGITHGYVGDVRVQLISPSGTPVILHNRSGGSTDDIDGTYGLDLTSFEPLSRLDGESSSGTWILEVHDGVPGDTGTLDSVSLEICGRPFEAAPPEMRLRRPSREPGGVLLEWWPYPGLTAYRVYRANDPYSAGAFADVTTEDDDDGDVRFLDGTGDPLAFYLVTGVGQGGEGPKGHFGE